jgi:hypothetical protein
VGDDEGERAGMLGAAVEEVDVEAVDGGRELGRACSLASTWRQSCSLAQ